MIAAAMDTTQLPAPQLFVDATSHIASMPLLPAHPDVKKLSATATHTIKVLGRLGAIPIGIEVKVGNAVPGNQEQALVLLDSLRGAAAILTGYRAKILERDLARFVPHLAPKYILARQRALNKLNEIRAALAFFLGEDDDMTLGYEFVPPPPPTSSGPSVPFDFG